MPQLLAIYRHLEQFWERESTIIKQAFSMWEFRFVYRDLVDITSRNRKLRMHFGRILKRAVENVTAILKGLAEAEIMRASRAEIEATATNVILICTFWLSFNTTRGANADKGNEDLGQGIFQVMMLIAPFLRDAERLHLNTLANTYRK